jgi:hypothetical protein
VIKEFDKNQMPTIKEFIFEFIPKHIIIKSYDLVTKSRHNIFEPILKIIFSTIASGATPIGSAGRAPDDVFS